ncbi:hypothetical protein OIO90_006434 [Microbotryomycetes sp. JL221]|nr:hypothetical protein OIO90_006434 [Microbotryomycetes sp. JL221]
MKVAVVGAGTAGLGASWALNKFSEHEVHLFEADSRWGGHANTVSFSRPTATGSNDRTGQPAATHNVDTGFIVFNRVTYPNFLAFLHLEQVPYIGSDMSFAVTRDRGAFEWSGSSLSSLFAQKSNLLNPAHWRMVWDIVRFNTAALTLLREADTGESIGDYVEKHGYSAAFVDNYLLPMTAAIWSTPPDKAALDFPALTLIRFMHNHHLLQILDRPTWLTIKDGSHTYVNSIVNQIPLEQQHRSSRIHSASSRDGKVVLATEAGEAFEFDHVIFACHADTTLKILERGEGVTTEERRVLGGFEFSKNRAILHADLEMMPNRRSTWSAWNYLTFSEGKRANVNRVSLTYWMNLLQSIPESEFGPVLVTLNPPFEPKPELVIDEYWYQHPLFSEQSVRSQSRLPEIQNQRGITFAGAWTKYGFHEDGFSSGLRVAAHYLGAKLPFEVRHAERDISETNTDKFAAFVLNIAEQVRRLFATPFAVFLMLIAVGLGLLEVCLKASIGALAAVHADTSKQRLVRLRNAVSTTRSSWRAQSSREKDE